MQRIPRLTILRKSLAPGIVLLVALLPVIGMAGQFDKQWERCLSAIRGNHYAIGTKGKVIEDLMQKLAPLAKQAPSREQFKKAVNEMIEEIGDSHFKLFTDEDQTYCIMDSVLRGGRSSKMPFIGAFFNEGTGSASEVFAYIMKASKRAKLLGRRTAGKLLTGTPVRISSWAILIIPHANVLLDANESKAQG